MPRRFPTLVLTRSMVFFPWFLVWLVCDKYHFPLDTYILRHGKARKFCPIRKLGAH
ncbi:uncharacterized protein BT62DRAFT_926462 [Guyanagaster necrorhizus]|uniref:Uncharacterized protein n=1 Tax=Guyanagaster necrorhizus TaxID=856835 RepID=A0A9P7W2P7_9AGAR|nr:uncharacterized protein BT62DRAFT_926462 [Guyanagaster necrorhizus MCA 3950]KAG7452251.1 hypothetical protein BT62DRAFT_926462 [Guyanagaster necrorhizus MCA 3950]